MLLFDGERVKTGMFPNHETYVDIDFIKELQIKGAKATEHIVKMDFEGNDDLVNLIFLKGALDDAGITNVLLIAHYLPYSTMDRTEGLRALSCKYVSQVINRLGFKAVYIKEAHSAVALATLDRVDNDEYSSFRVVKSVIFNLLNEGCAQSDILIVFPDAGAEKRYGHMFGEKCFGRDYPERFATATLAKTRDFVTGQIIGMKFVDGEENVKPGMMAIIIDDLCRGGRTFVGAGLALKIRNVDKVVLCVTHLEDSVFSGPMLAGDEVDEIYAYNHCIFSAKKHDKIHAIDHRTI